MAIRMQQRRGTADQWLLADPVLGAGEIGVETDTSSFKVGDGVNSWALLEYFTNAEGLAASLENYVNVDQLGVPNGVPTLDANGFVPASQLAIDVTADINAAVAALVDTAPETLDTLSELAAAIGDDASFITTINTSITDGDSATLISANTYTDDAIEAIPATDLTGYATETYVGDAIAAIPAPDYTGLATETYVSDAIDAVVGLAPETLDTLSELATALGDDPAFITNISQDIVDAQAAAEATAATDATTKADSAESAAISAAATDATAKANAALASAEAYADTAEADAISAAALDATTKANAALSSAQAYADTAETDAVATANAYTDTSIGNIPAVDLTGYATETYVGVAVSNLVDSAPGTLDTLNELAAALGDDANFATTVAISLSNKADLSSPAFTGTVDFSNSTVQGIEIPQPIHAFTMIG
jgi:hypothetical protein